MLNKIVDAYLKCRKRYIFHCLFNHIFLPLYFTVKWFCCYLMIGYSLHVIWGQIMLQTGYYLQKNRKTCQCFNKKILIFHCKICDKIEKMHSGQWIMSYFEAYVLVNAINMCLTWCLIAKYLSESDINHKYEVKSLWDCV